MVAMFAQLSAQKYDYLRLGDISTSSHVRNAISIQGSGMDDAGNDFEILPRNTRVMKPTRSEVKFKDVTIDQPGTLASVLGDEINDIDSLVVRGPINAADFHTIWSSSFYGGLTVANLEYAQIAGNRIPKNAFGISRSNILPVRSILIAFPFAESYFPRVWLR